MRFLPSLNEGKKQIYRRAELQSPWELEELRPPATHTRGTLGYLDDSLGLPLAMGFRGGLPAESAGPVEPAGAESSSVPLWTLTNKFFFLFVSSLSRTSADTRVQSQPCPLLPMAVTWQPTQTLTATSLFGRYGITSKAVVHVCDSSALVHSHLHIKKRFFYSDS